MTRGLRLRCARPAVAAARLVVLAGIVLAGCSGPSPAPGERQPSSAERADRAAPKPIPELPKVVRPEPTEADKVVVVKGLRQLRLLANGEVFRTYDVSLGREPVGDKLWEGDGRTPEGRYVLDFKNENSAFHRSIRISYPNAEDWREARALGVHPGSDIMIHGLKPEFADVGKGHLREDWTEGCIAVTNAEINEIWSLVPIGTPIEIRP